MIDIKDCSILATFIAKFIVFQKVGCMAQW